MRRLAAAAAFAAALFALPGAQAAEKASVAVLPFISSSPIFIAVERGHFAAEGLDVKLEMFTAAQPVVTAIVAGSADFGVTAFTAGFFNLAGKGALKVVGAQSREEPGYDFSGIVAANKAFAEGLDAPAKFEGRSLAITQKGSSYHLMIGLLAKKLNFDVNKVRLVTLESTPNMIAALKSGQVDGAILPAQFVTGLVARGEAKPLGWVHQHVEYQLGGLFTSTKNVNDRRPLVEAFVRAYQKGASDYAEAFLERDASGKRVFGEKAKALTPIIAKYTKSTPEEIEAGATYIDPQGRLKVQSIYDQVAFFQSQGMVDKDVDASKFIDLSFIKGHFDVPAK